MLHYCYMAVETDLKKNTKELQSLRESIARGNRLGGVFLRGLVGGIGTAIGATVIAAIVITVLLQVLQITGLGKILPSALTDQLSTTAW